jgi:hypothetical protein
MSKISEFLILLFHDHDWENEKSTRMGGWYSAGGFPEMEERECKICGMKQQR